jgi:aconitase A
VVLAGKEYGSGSSRDWAAKGTSLLGVKAVIAESYERIHRSNLIGMGVIPLQFPEGETPSRSASTGEETFSITGITALNDGTTPKTVTVTAPRPTGRPTVEFDAVVRIDTPGEADYYRNGGILQYVLRLDKEALTSLLIMLLPMLGVATRIKGVDPFLGLAAGDENRRHEAARRLVRVLSAAIRQER